MASNSAQERRRRLQVRPRNLQDGPRRPKKCPRGLQDGPGGLREALQEEPCSATPTRLSWPRWRS
eukprot:5139916-Pyramimonas_sp.AAC.1